MNKLLTIITLLVLLGCSKKEDNASAVFHLGGEWEKQPSSFPILLPRGAVSFCIGDAYYIGLGATSIAFDDEEQKLFFRFTPEYGWKTLSAFPGRGRENATAFVIDDKVYVGLGKTISKRAFSEECLNDFWVYNPQLDQWDSIPQPYPGEKCIGCVSFSVNDKGIVGTGSDLKGVLTGDFYEFSPATGWSQVLSLFLNSRAFSTVFTINRDIYLCFGKGVGWCRDINKLSSSPLFWTQKRPIKYQDIDITRDKATAVVLNEDGKDYAYVFGGNVDKWCVRYDSEADKWQEVIDFPKVSNCFVLKNTLYMLSNNFVYKFRKI